MTIFRKKPSREFQARCGHKTTQRIKVRSGKKEVEYILSIGGYEKPQWCKECIQEYMITACAWCGGPIFPFDEVTFHGSADLNFKEPDNVVRSPYDATKFMGCTSKKCMFTRKAHGLWLPDIDERGNSIFDENGNPRCTVLEKNGIDSIEHPDNGVYRLRDNARGFYKLLLSYGYKEYPPLIRVL